MQKIKHLVVAITKGSWYSSTDLFDHEEIERLNNSLQQLRQPLFGLAVMLYFDNEYSVAPGPIIT